MFILTHQTTVYHLDIYFNDQAISNVCDCSLFWWKWLLWIDADAIIKWYSSMLSTFLCFSFPSIKQTFQVNLLFSVEIFSPTRTATEELVEETIEESEKNRKTMRNKKQKGVYVSQRRNGLVLLRWEHCFGNNQSFQILKRIHTKITNSFRHKNYVIIKCRRKKRNMSFRYWQNAGYSLRKKLIHKQFDRIEFAATLQVTICSTFKQ